MHGQGTWTYPDGSAYDGEWAESKMHGRGTYTYALDSDRTGSFASR